MYIRYARARVCARVWVKRENKVYYNLSNFKNQVLEIYIIEFQLLFCFLYFKNYIISHIYFISNQNSLNTTVLCIYKSDQTKWLL